MGAGFLNLLRHHLECLPLTLCQGLRLDRVVALALIACNQLFLINIECLISAVFALDGDFERRAWLIFGFFLRRFCFGFINCAFRLVGFLLRVLLRCCVSFLFVGCL